MKNFFGVILILCAATPVAAAQTQWEFAPALGMYFPTNSSHSVADGVKRQIPAAAVSAHVGFWPTAKLGVEAGLAFSPSLIAHETPGQIRDIHAAVMTAGARAMWRGSAVRFGAGVGLVNGEWAPQVAFALRMPLTATWYADLQLQDFIRTPRHDIIWGLAFVIPLSRP